MSGKRNGICGILEENKNKKRKWMAKTPIADGVSPRAGYDTHGPTAAANSVSKLELCKRLRNYF